MEIKNKGKRRKYKKVKKTCLRKEKQKIIIIETNLVKNKKVGRRKKEEINWK